MTHQPGRVLAGTFPPPVRQRWGAELAAEIGARGARGWANTLAGAAALWLRPAQWPASTGSHVRRAVVVLALVTTALTGLGARGIIGTTADVNPRITTVGLATLIIGLAVLLPLPYATWPSVRAVTRATVRPAAFAGALSVAVWIAAQLLPELHSLARAAEVACYWLALSMMLISPAIALARIDPRHLRLPGPTRAAVGLAAIILGQTICGSAEISGSAASSATAVGLLELALAAITTLALIDLRHHRASDPADTPDRP